MVVLVVLGRPPGPLRVLGLAEDPPHGLRGLRLVADQLDRLGPALPTVTVVITHTIILNLVQRNRDMSLCQLCLVLILSKIMT